MEKKNPVFLAYRQVKAQLTIYTLAMLFHVTNGKLSLYKIWQRQDLSENLKAFINNLSQQLYDKLTEAQPKGTTFRDYCKSARTRESTKKFVLSLDLSSIADDMASESEEIERSTHQEDQEAATKESSSEKGTSALNREKGSSTIYKRIQKISDEDWQKIKMLVARICTKEEANMMKKFASQNDKSKLSYNKLVVIGTILDKINENFKLTIGREF